MSEGLLLNDEDVAVLQGLIEQAFNDGFDEAELVALWEKVAAHLDL